MKYKVSATNKAWVYRTLKGILKSFSGPGRPGRNARRQFMKLILKFTPGDDYIFLNDIERHILLSWLLRIKQAALVRADKFVSERVSETIDGLGTPYGRRDS